MSCECEHVSHFENEPGVHQYGEVPATHVVDTAWGKFKMCQECSKGHGAPEYYENPREL